MNKTVIVLIFCLLSSGLYAQQRIELVQTGLFTNSNSSAKVYINEDPKLLGVINHHKKVSKNNLEIKGWRIGVFMGSGKNARSQANNVKLKIRNRYAEVEPHLVHHSPYFKILVGDFRTRIEAESFRKKLLREYPNCYVVESEVLIDNL